MVLSIVNHLQGMKYNIVFSFHYSIQTMHPMEHFPIMVFDIADEFRQLNRFTTRLISYIRHAIRYMILLRIPSIPHK